MGTSKAKAPTDPIREFEHSHGHLTKTALAIGQQLRDDKGHARALSAAARKELLDLLESLRDELLQHFADEEEALFPFVRNVVPAKATVVDKLEASHDTICGSIVRIAHLASHGSDAPLVALYERFEHAYAEHSSDERHLFDELSRALDDAQRRELSALLRGISHR